MTETRDLASLARTLKDLHRPGDPVVLPTCWDAWSAHLAVEAGFEALTVGSHPMAESIGAGDGEQMTFEQVTTRVAQITAAVDVTCDSIRDVACSISSSSPWAWAKKPRTVRAWAGPSSPGPISSTKKRYPFCVGTRPADVCGCAR